MKTTTNPTNRTTIATAAARLRAAAVETSLPIYADIAAAAVRAAATERAAIGPALYPIMLKDKEYAPQDLRRARARAAATERAYRESRAALENYRAAIADRAAHIRATAAEMRAAAAAERAAVSRTATAAAERAAERARAAAERLVQLERAACRHAAERAEYCEPYASILEAIDRTAVFGTTTYNEVTAEMRTSNEYRAVYCATIRRNRAALEDIRAAAAVHAAAEAERAAAEAERAAAEARAEALNAAADAYTAPTISAAGIPTAAEVDSKRAAAERAAADLRNITAATITDSTTAAAAYLEDIAAAEREPYTLRAVLNAITAEIERATAPTTPAPRHEYLITVYSTEDSRDIIAQSIIVDEPREPDFIPQTAIDIADNMIAAISATTDKPLRSCIVYAPNSARDCIICAKDIARRTIRAALTRMIRLSEDYTTITRNADGNVIEIERAESERLKKYVDKLLNAPISLTKEDGTHRDTVQNYMINLFRAVGLIRESDNGLWIDTDAEQTQSRRAYPISALYADARDIVSAAYWSIYRARNLTAHTIYRAAAKAINARINESRAYKQAYKPWKDAERERAAAKLTRDISLILEGGLITPRQAEAMQRRVDGLSVEAIAAEQGVTRQAVQKRLDAAAENLLLQYIGTAEKNGKTVNRMREALKALKQKTK